LPVSTSGHRSLPLRTILGFAVYVLLVPATLMVASGDPGWWMGWLYSALGVGAIVISRLIVLRKSPDTLQERARFAEAEDVASGDRALVLVIAIIGPWIVALVSGLDHRLGWPPPLPAALQIVGVAALTLGYSLAVWAMVVNEFFSAVVRIQSDRGHRVVERGPYASIRHPAYAGAILSTLGGPIMLDTVWSLIPGVVILVAILLRTQLEDRTLQTSLPGYPDYASRVRDRLLPGVW
jgi:protein-S-isoprenylcysteine O-methyltransferase Ste14